MAEEGGVGEVEEGSLEGRRVEGKEEERREGEGIEVPLVGGRGGSWG